MTRSHRARLPVRESNGLRSPGIISKSSLRILARSAVAGAAFAGAVLTQCETADAVPSFARQTGYYCSTCHTVQPELTPFGRQFKLNGYTAGGARCGDSSRIFGNADSSPEWSGANLSMWLLPAFNHFAKDLPPGALPNPNFPANNIWDLSDASVFYAGQIYCNLGIFSQYSYSSTGSAQGTGQIFLDNTELRYTEKLNIAGNDVVWGVLGNNNPTMQDVWNTVPAWAYPWVPIDITFGPPGAMIEGTFAQRSYGAGTYAWVNNMFYAELSVYRAYDWHMQQATGFNPTDGQPRIDGLAPYWRLAVEKTWNENSLMVGAYGMYAAQMPTTPGTGLLTYPGYTDKYLDVAVDAQYQYIGPIHAFTVRAYYIQEWQKLDATYFGSLALTPGAPGASEVDQSLSSFNISASYIYDRHISFTADYFDVRGSSDATYWNAVLTNNASRPDTNGVSFDLAYVPFPYGGPDLWPWLNARMGVLYTHFNKFNGSATNYSADPAVAPRNARDNDQVFLYSWIDF